MWPRYLASSSSSSAAAVVCPPVLLSPLAIPFPHVIRSRASYSFSPLPWSRDFGLSSTGTGQSWEWRQSTLCSKGQYLDPKKSRRLFGGVAASPQSLSPIVEKIPRITRHTASRSPICRRIQNLHGPQILLFHATLLACILLNPPLPLYSQTSSNQDGPRSLHCRTNGSIRPPPWVSFQGSKRRSLRQQTTLQQSAWQHAESRTLKNVGSLSWSKTVKNKAHNLLST
jgi:hypothetical protein